MEVLLLLLEYVIECFVVLFEWECYGLLVVLLCVVDLFGLLEEDVEEE